MLQSKQWHLVLPVLLTNKEAISSYSTFSLTSCMYLWFSFLLMICVPLAMLAWQDSDIWWPVLCINFIFWHFAMKQLPQILLITEKKSINKEIASARPIKCIWMPQFFKYLVISYLCSQLSAHCHQAASSQVLHCPQVSPTSAGCLAWAADWPHTERAVCYFQMWRKQSLK